MASTQLQSTRYQVSDTAEAIEFYYSKGWTDGLPVVPPTEGSIRAMLDAAGLEPGEEITFIENRQVSVTAEKVAINAVMAGCKPEYMPVVVARPSKHLAIPFTAITGRRPAPEAQRCLCWSMDRLPVSWG